MPTMPDVVPVSDLRGRHKEIFQKIEDGPILLAQHSRPAAVLVSVADWNAREKQLELLEARLKYLEMKRQYEENPPKLISFDEIEEEIKARQ
ncbi:MAG: type II toxin-antitoxin system prevent-host-death family antitoxin [Caldilineaceae bacterium]|nr:type II toxin-antitoxin system prevent-host-death family antitoxin [Caldilineaceae bacterium]